MPSRLPELLDRSVQEIGALCPDGVRLLFVLTGQHVVGHGGFHLPGEPVDVVLVVEPIGVEDAEEQERVVGETYS